MSQTLRGLMAAIALIAVTTVSAEAQKDQGSRFAVMGGYVTPTGDAGDLLDGGFTLGGAAYFSAGSITMRVNGDWTRFADKFDGDARITQIGVMVNALLPFGEGPYGLGGIGFYNQKASYLGESLEEETDLAWNVGFGFSGKTTFIEARYQTVIGEGSDITTFPIVLGFKF